MPEKDDPIEQFCQMSDSDKVQMAAALSPGEMVGYLCLFAKEIRNLRDKIMEVSIENMTP